ncbi:MAG: metallopeptidase TldD-related protein [Candidatus Kapaibacteriota bacterium]
MKKLSCLFVIILTFACFYSTHAISHLEILQALKTELKRSMDSLYIENLPKPYFIEYSLKVSDVYRATSFLGYIVDSNSTKKATINVKLRVGDYKLDNTNYLDFSFSFIFGGLEESSPTRSVPIDFDYYSLRRELWLATDFAYKSAAKTYSKKIATLKNRIIKDTIPDFAYAKPFKSIDTGFTLPIIDLSKICLMLKNLSNIYRDYPLINNSSVSFEYIQDIVYYVNSEGSEYIKPTLFTGFETAGSLQAPDGMPLNNFYSVYSTTPNKLPSYDSLQKAINLICKNLTALYNSKTLEDSYSGPILFTEQAACEIFAQVFLPNLVAQRPLLSEQGTQQLSRFNSFQTKIGGRVLPDFMSVYSVPLKSESKNIELVGHFKVDDEGTPAENITLVENGYLKTLLSNRTPTKRILKSNGNDRNGSPMFSNIEIVSNNKYSKPYRELKQKLIQLCQQRELPYGIIVKKVMNQNIYVTVFPLISPIEFKFSGDQNVITVVEAYKVYPDGREELIRGAELKGITPQSFKDIILVGNKTYLLNLLAPVVSSSFSSGGYVGTSILAPDLLFEDAEIRPMDFDFPKPPYLDNPLILND